MKRTPLRARSAKQARIDRIRIRVKRRLLDEDPMCRRCRTSPGTDLHEKLRRSQGGDPTDEKVMALICAGCHADIHANPERARQDGWLTFRKDLGGTAA